MIRKIKAITIRVELLYREDNTQLQEDQDKEDYCHHTLSGVVKKKNHTKIQKDQDEEDYNNHAQSGVVIKGRSHTVTGRSG